VVGVALENAALEIDQDRLIIDAGKACSCIRASVLVHLIFCAEKFKVERHRGQQSS
jgi:hypothetical protein